MEFKKRAVVATIWVAVAALIALPLEVGMPSSGGEVLRLFVVGLALFLAAVYLLDPRGVATTGPFESIDS